MNSYKYSFVFLGCLLCVCEAYYSKNEVDLIQNSSEHLSKELKKFGNKILGISNIESIYRTEANLKENTFNVTEETEEIAIRIGSRLDSAIDILRKSKDFIEHATSRNQVSHGLQPCCSPDSDKRVFDSKFFRQVIPETCCLKCQLNFLGNDSFDFYRSNLESSPFVLWQYFGDIEGRYFQYPTDDNKMCNKNESLDNRFQEWYVHTASPQKKNIVIVIDASGSMSIEIGFPNNRNTPSREQIAKEAANTVLDTLSSSDFVGVVAFNETAISSKCRHRDMMVRSSPDNKDSVKDFIQDIHSAGDTYYRKAFQRAFSFLNTTKTTNPKQFQDSLDIILFLTDGTPSDKHEEIMSEIQRGQSLMNQSVHIFIYGFGTEITNLSNPLEKKFIVQLADQNNLVLKNSFGSQSQLVWPVMIGNNQPVGPHGNYFLIPDTNAHQLKGIMGRYYAQFPMSNQSDATISLPQNDPYAGQLITLGLPTMNLISGEFTGVVALDISVELTFYEVQHFRLGRHSYSFLVNGDGTVVLHPDIQITDRDKQPVFYSIEQIEPVLSKEAVINITQGIPGQEEVTRQIKDMDGQSSKSLQVTYYYMPVQGYKGNFTIVLVIFQEDKKHDTVRSSRVQSFPHFVYHRLDYVENITMEDTNICIRDKRMIMPNNATVKFAPSSFSQPEQNMMFEQNSSYINLFYLPYNSTADFSKQTGVMDPAAKDVLLTHKLDEYWRVESDIIWRYLGTESGLFRVYPGTLVPDTLYDPRGDGWYTRASDRPDQYMFTKTDHRVDNSTIVTVSKAFHLSKDSVHGVIAADISYRHFVAFLYNSIKEVITSKTECFLLNNDGHILTQFKDSGPLTNVTNSLHITEAFPHIASWMVSRHYLKPNWCTDLSSDETRMTFDLDTKGQTIVPVSSDPCLNIILLPLSRTNLFLLTRKDPNRCVTADKNKVCPCHPVCRTCSAGVSATCQCPCSCQSLGLERCSNKLDHTMLYRPCTDNTKHWRNFKKQQANITNISNTSKCQEPCTTITNASQCSSQPGCIWCQSGHYRTMPLCSQKCIKDRMNVTLQSECLNLTTLSAIERDSLLNSVHKLMVKKMKRYKDALVHKPVLTEKLDLTYMLENRVVDDIPQSWKDVSNEPLTVPINTSVEQLNLTLVSSGAPVVRYKVSLQLMGINFTEVLETALTLRSLVEKTVKELCRKTLSKEVAKTLDKIWPEESQIDFELSKPDQMTSVLFSDEISALKAYFHNGVEYDLIGRHVRVTNLTTSGHGSLSCDAPCHLVDMREVCEKTKKCRWDNYLNNCSSNSYLPERLDVSVYFPCLSLYDAVSQPDLDDLLSNFQVKVRKMAGGLSYKALHSFSLDKHDQMIGRKVSFTIQGTVHDPTVSETWWSLKQGLDWSNKFYIQSGNMSFQSSVVSTSYWQFTHMQIVLVVSSLDVDDFLQKNPLNGRREITLSVQSIADRHLLPTVAATVTNVWMKQNTVPFLVSKSAFSKIDLKDEYERLKHSIDQGNVYLEVLNKSYKVDSSYFIGSFNGICPRNCSDGTSETVCGTIPGCYWADNDGVQNCTEDSLLPEMYNVTVLLSCANLNNQTDDQVNKTLDDLKRQIRQYLKKFIPCSGVHSFHVGQDFTDSVTFNLQSTILGPSLKHIVHNLTLWISEGHLKVHIPGHPTPLIAKYVAEYDSAEVAIKYSSSYFSSSSFLTRKIIKKQLQRQITDALAINFTLNTDSIWFYKNFFIFTIKRTSNLDNLDKEVERLGQISKIGGFSIRLNGTKMTPVKLESQGKLIAACPVSCLNSSVSKTCKKMTGCFYKGSWHADHCANNTTVTKRYSYKLFIPCNATQRLNFSERVEAETDLMDKVQSLLSQAGSQVIQGTIIDEDGAYVILKASTLYPHLDQYISQLQRNLDYSHNFAFGPQRNQRMFSPRDPKDFTNVEVEMTFGSIDFGVLQSSGKASFEDIAHEFQRQLNKILLGEIAQSCKVVRIIKENILFKLHKTKDSLVSMASEMKKIQKVVEDRRFVLDVHYIRPVVATALATKGSFKELCPDRYPVFTSVSPTTVVTSHNYTQVTVTPSRRPSVTVIYNGTELSTQELHSLFPNGDLNMCLVEVRSCQYCLDYFSWRTCRFSNVYTTSSAPVPESTTVKPAILPEDDLIFGPVQITIMAVSGFFLLALALWGIDYVRQMNKKGTQKNKSASDKDNNCGGIEDTSGAE